MKKAMMLGAGLVLAGSLSAATHTWKRAAEGRVNDWDWSNGGNFVERTAPSTGDTVVIPGEERVRVKADDATSRGILNGLTLVNTVDSGATVEIEVAGGKGPFEVKPEIRYAGKDGAEAANGLGRIVKTGEGTLILTATGGHAYHVDLEVVAGALKMNPKASSGSNYFFSSLSISNNAALFTAPNGGYTRCGYVYGTGTITNDTVASVFRPMSGSRERPNEIAAFLSSAISFWPAGYVRTTCPTNANRYCYVWRDTARQPITSAKGVLEVLSFGNRMEPSFIGALDFMQTSSGGGLFRYVGDTDATVGTKLSVGAPCEGPSGIDAGAHGGLTFTNYWEVTSRAPTGICDFYLMGSNAVPCKLDNLGFNDHNLSCFSFHKTGTGTWRVTDTGAQKFRGSFWIDEGTMQFETMAEAGSACSMGLALLLYPRGYYGALDGTGTVDYAVSLGATGTVGTFEYVGTNTVRQQTRPVALAGDGRLVNAAADNGAEARRYLSWTAGFSSIEDGLNRLILDGTSANGGDEVANVTDGAKGRVGVVKRGTGTWRLSGVNTFSGPIEVEAGKLVLVTPHYTWFRVTMKGIKWLDYKGKPDNPYPNGKYETSLHELAFFDKDGYRQNIGLTEIKDERKQLYSGVHPATYFRDVILPGECTYAETPFFDSASGGWYFGSSSERLFDNNSTVGNWSFQRYLPNTQGATGMDTYPLPILFRLPEGAKPVTTYDIVTHRDSINNLSSYVIHPKCWTVEGSVDGKTWDLLHTMEDSGVTGQTLSIHGAGRWMSKDEAFSPEHGVKVPHTGGQAIAAAPNGAIAASFAAVESVSVAEGATLVAEGDITIDGLKVDYGKGAGTMTGFAFADEGTFTVENIPLDEATVTLPGTYDRKIAGWTLASSNPKIARRVMTMDKDGHVTLYKRGSAIIVR